MDRECDDMVTASMSHGPPFDVILLFVKYNRYKVGTVKLISGGGDGGEAVGSDEEGDVRNIEGGGADVGTTPLFYGP